MSEGSCLQLFNQLVSLSLRPADKIFLFAELSSHQLAWFDPDAGCPEFRVFFLEQPPLGVCPLVPREQVPKYVPFGTFLDLLVSLGSFLEKEPRGGPAKNQARPVFWAPCRFVLFIVKHCGSSHSVLTLMDRAKSVSSEHLYSGSVGGFGFCDLTFFKFLASIFTALPTC